MSITYNMLLCVWELFSKDGRLDILCCWMVRGSLLALSTCDQALSSPQYQEDLAKDSLTRVKEVNPLRYHPRGFKVRGFSWARFFSFFLKRVKRNIWVSHFFKRKKSKCQKLSKCRKFLSVEKKIIWGLHWLTAVDHHVVIIWKNILKWKIFFNKSHVRV